MKKIKKIKGFRSPRNEANKTIILDELMYNDREWQGRRPHKLNGANLMAHFDDHMLRKDKNFAWLFWAHYLTP